MDFLQALKSLPLGYELFERTFASEIWGDLFSGGLIYLFIYLFFVGGGGRGGGVLSVYYIQSKLR